MKLLLLLPLILALFFFAPLPSDAHRDGCHTWHSCPSDSGSYVCGDKGYSNECPSKVSAPKNTTPIESEVCCDPLPISSSKVTYPDKLTLKQQIESQLPVSEILCNDNSHVLVERVNGKLACVYSETAEKLNWSIIKSP